ncbi:lysozyme inhibitor LprI family protein [[Phormidium] sp. ETS-05]|uniref:lysozyme inhibitor LprI family protein n=1 Tax=[Phormidium] sp. ETS-05 TaxID=222819 RepID=UPI0018EEE73D|nr:lysozyme inhibitor LprI family protein [[Phormidium] sp. ETS-05]
MEYLTWPIFRAAIAAFLSLHPLITSSATAQQPNCNDMGNLNQLQMNQCAAIFYQNADQKLNQVYQQLPAATREQLTDTQLAWIKFRDDSCAFSRSRFEGGTIMPTIFYGCLTSVTKNRTAEFQAYRQGQILPANGNNYQAVDNRLNQVYQQTLNRFSSHREQLIDAQLAWIDFRDANCAFESNRVSGGRNICLIRMTEIRTQELVDIQEMIP